VTATIAAVLADWATSMTYDELPVTVREAAKSHIRDGLGVGIAASALPDSRALIVGALRIAGGSDLATVLGSGRSSPATPALINGRLIHALEYDDTHMSSVIHGTAVALAASLAAGEMSRCHGRELITAFVIAWEIMVRLGQASPGGYQVAGFQTSGACGPFGAAAAAGVLIGLDAGRMTAAFGIAGSSAAGLMQYAVDGANSKRTHLGKAAHDGLLAASWAWAVARPASDADMDRKFRRNVETVLTAKQASDLSLAISQLDDHPDLLNLIGLLGANETKKES
jgi:2-methylcitrate dehydratase PrpD